MMIRTHLLWLALVASLTQPGTLQAQHAHLNAGVLDSGQNVPLRFANGDDFAAEGGYVKTLAFTNAGTYAGLFEGNLTLTVLPATAENGGPDPAAPALGSMISVQLVSLEGPRGGVFGFWEAGATAATFSLGTGQTGTNSWRLSENDGTPGTDPYGHIHGRHWTLNLPGVYRLGLRLLDRSTNGPAGGPIYQPSEVLSLYVQAGVNVYSLEPDGDHSHIRFAAPSGSVWQIQASPTLGQGDSWTNVGSAVAADDYLQEVEEHLSATARRFYRLQQVAP